MSKNGSVTLTNKWGVTLLEVHIRHRLSNDPNREHSKSFYYLPANETTEKLPIKYETFSTSFDYWWIKFVTLGGIEYETDNDNFKSNITDRDDGNVNIKIDPGTKKMYVTFSSSGGDSCGLKKSVDIK